jgi:uncharacterized protein (DUF952 family)
VTDEAVVYKICPRAAWQEALGLGRLEPSADDRRDGFLHLSARDQLPGTLERHFAGQTDLVLLSVPVAGLAPGALRWEESRGGKRFPHLYAPLLVSQVSQVTELSSHAGSPALPDEI